MVDAERSEEVAAPLLDRIRSELGDPGVRYAQAPARVFGGNHTFVHGLELSGAPPGWDGPLVVRILRAHRAGEEVRVESAVQNALQPLAPRVLLHGEDAELLGGAFALMQRVPGSALLLEDVGAGSGGRIGMLRQLLAGFREAAFGPWPILMAETHARLHALDPDPVRRAVAEAGFGERLSLAWRLEQLRAEALESGLDGLGPGLDWLSEHQSDLTAPACVCHGDLFPNQIFAMGGVVTGVIDWADTLLAPGSVDVGFTCAGLSTLPLPAPLVGLLTRRAVRLFREAYQNDRAIDAGAFRYGEVLRIVRTLIAVGAFRAGHGPEPGPYAAPAGVRLLHAHLGNAGIPGGLF